MHKAYSCPFQVRACSIIDDKQRVIIVTIIIVIIIIYGSNTGQTGVMIVQHMHYAKVALSCSSQARSRYILYVSVYFKAARVKAIY